MSTFESCIPFTTPPLSNFLLRWYLQNSFFAKHSKNISARHLTHQATKNAKKVAKALLLKSYGLSIDGNTIGNVYKAGQLIEEKDKTLRHKIGDYSSDFWGILRSFKIEGGDYDIKDNYSIPLKILLYNKAQVMIFHEVADTRKLTFHLDGITLESELGIELLEGAIVLHHIASINVNAFVDGKDKNKLV